MSWGLSSCQSLGQPPLCRGLADSQPVWPRTMCPAAQVRHAPSGPELVVAGGYCDGVLAHMELFTLSLTTFLWDKYPGLMPGQGRQLPTPCQRVGTLRLTRDWLLMLGGCPEQVRISISCCASTPPCCSCAPAAAARLRNPRACLPQHGLPCSAVGA